MLLIIRWVMICLQRLTHHDLSSDSKLEAWVGQGPDIIESFLGSAAVPWPD